MRRWLPFVFVVLAACLPREEAPEIGPEVADRAEAACARDEGRWVPLGNSGTMICLRTPPDANKACTTQNDCSTQCLARSKTCAPVDPLFGCNDVIGRNGAVATLCVE